MLAGRAQVGSSARHDREVLRRDLLLRVVARRISPGELDPQRLGAGERDGREEPRHLQAASQSGAESRRRWRCVMVKQRDASAAKQQVAGWPAREEALEKRTSHDDALREAAMPMLLRFLLQLPRGPEGFSRPCSESGHCLRDRLPKLG